MKSSTIRRTAGAFLFLACWLYFLRTIPARETAAPWSEEIEKALKAAGNNRVELEKALVQAPERERKGMAFLIANMPARGLKSLRADFLLENVDIAYRARKEAAWGARIPEDVFLNDVLPYANIDETRDPWRKELYELCMPLVKDCKAPAEAARKLNGVVFTKLKVRYSTQRKQANQNPKESIEQGLASCSGLSVLLSDACRSVSIPARLVGTPLWADNSGNHTWVEIWDDGWHFTGAAEPDPQGLDHAWFEPIASQSRQDVPENAIYAASFRRTALSFPLVWAPDRKDVYAENVTRRYAKAGKPGPTKDQLERVEKEAASFFQADEKEQAKWKSDAALDVIVAEHDAAVRAAVWKAYQTAPIHEKLKADYSANQVRYKDYVSPYVVREVGEKPTKGWPLVIALHGGGGAAKEVNDSQWNIMQRYYKDHPEVTGYKYLALRAPNDAWNGFYDDYVPPLVISLIRQFRLFGGVDSDRVFLIGYSHGGYCAFFIGPKIPDRFAAVHSSAAAPTDGTISAANLRNTPFTFMVGGEDNAYGRRKRCEQFEMEIQKLKDGNKGDYPVQFELKKGFSHSNLPDRDKLKEMLVFARNPTPRRLTWEPTDALITDFFWLTVPEPDKGQRVEAALRDNNAIIATHGIKDFDLDLDGRLVDLDKPLCVTLDGKTETVTMHPQLKILCQSILQRGDPELAFSCQVHLVPSRKAD